MGMLYSGLKNVQTKEERMTKMNENFKRLLADKCVLDDLRHF